MTGLKRVYLDHNATTKPRSEVVAEMLDPLNDLFANPSSLHSPGRDAQKAIELARERVAWGIGARADEVVFTSGGTEANNQVIFGVAHALASKGRTIITTAVEHQAVLNPCERLTDAGYDIIHLTVDSNGLIDPVDLEKKMTADTILVSVMLANNETGTIQPIREVAAVTRRKGVLFHCDAVQGLGKIPVDVNELGVDFMTISGHKIYGPKGIGALYIRQGAPDTPLIYGGYHEKGRRAGTENVPGIVGFGKACELSVSSLEEDRYRIAGLRDRLQEGILAQVPGTSVNGHPTLRLSNTLNITFPGLDSHIMTMSLDLVGISVSTGAACSSRERTSSHVLLAMGRSPEQTLSSIRFSLGRENTPDDIEYTIERVVMITTRRP